MKFTYQIGIAALFGSFAVTAPANTLSLSLSIKEGDVAAGHYSKDVVTKELTHLTEDDAICWRACFSESPNCPEGWHSTQLGSCWTCCGSTSEEVSIKSPTLALQHNKAVTNKHVGKDSANDAVTKELTDIVEGNDVCWLACFSQSPKCPENWYSNRLGDCWTCCRSS